MPRRTFIAAALVSALSSGALADGPASYQAVALEGQPVYGNPDASFTIFTAPTISNNGVVGFKCLTHVESNEIHGLFRWQAGDGLQVAEEGEPLGQHPFFFYQSFGTPVIDLAGRFAFFAHYSAAGGTGAIMAGAPGNFRVVAVAGTDPNPDPDYVNGIGVLGSPALSRHGRVGFSSGTQSVRQLWAGDTDGVVLVGDSPMPAPGYPAGATIGRYGLPRIDNHSNVWSFASLDGAGYNGQRVFALTGPDQASVPVGPDIPTPDVAGVFVAGGKPASINGSGEVGYHAFYVDDQTKLVTEGLWVGPPDAPTQIARLGTPAPGMPGFAFVNFRNSPLITRSGHAAIVAWAADGNTTRTAIWTWDGQELDLLVEYGDPIENLDDATFQEIESPGCCNDFAVNDRDQVAMIGRIDLAGAVAHALLATDLDGRLYAIATTGRPFEVANDDVRVIDDIFVHSTSTSGSIVGENGDDGHGTFFNDLGVLAFMLTFQDDTSGVFTARLGPPPCLTILDQDVVCHADGTTFTVNIEGLNACTGGTTQVTFTASGGAVGEALCFTALVNDGGFCCSTEICVTIPDCTLVPQQSDVDGDGAVGILDFLALLAGWGGCQDCGTCAADLDGDCSVGILDLLILLGNWT